MNRKKMNSGIGFQALFDFNTIEEAIDFAHGHGFGHVEIHLNNLKFLAELERTRKKFHFPLLIHAAEGFNLFVPYTKTRTASIEYLSYQMQLAQRIGARCLTFHLDSDVPFAINGVKHFAHQFFPDETHRWVIDGLEAVIHKTDCRTALCLENTAGFRYPFVQAIVNKFLGHGLSLTWDFGHTNCLKGLAREKELVFYGKKKKFVNNCHLHDNNHQVDQHRPVGSGTVNFKTFYQIVETAHPYLTIETRPKENAVLSLARLQKILQ